ncbi:MAG: hypothetical protein LBP29_01680, partial [Treponema sp.]|nr:hypothetical protein [Treponema sp.]
NEGRPFNRNDTSGLFRAYTVLTCLKNMLTGSHAVYEWGGRENRHELAPGTSSSGNSPLLQTAPRP